MARYAHPQAGICHILQANSFFALEAEGLVLSLQLPDLALQRGSPLMRSLGLPDQPLCPLLCPLQLHAIWESHQASAMHSSMRSQLFAAYILSDHPRLQMCLMRKAAPLLSSG